MDILATMSTKRRLNGWQRIGAVLSVLWALVGFFWGNEIGLHEGDWAEQAERICSEARNADLNACMVQFDKDWTQAIKYHWDYAFILSLVPIPLAWFLAYGIVRLTRWIRAGFVPRT